MRNLFITFAGYFLSKLHIVYSEYMNLWLCKRLGKAGENAIIHYPFKVIGEQNIFLEDDVSIGSGATIFTKNAKIIIGIKSFSGPNLTMISGDHPYLPSIYMRDICKMLLPNAREYDSDIIIERDVWIGTNVTILKGVRIGRGAVIAAGSLVVRDIPPYAIGGGDTCKSFEI